MYLSATFMSTTMLLSLGRMRVLRRTNKAPIPLDHMFYGAENSSDQNGCLFISTLPTACAASTWKLPASRVILTNSLTDISKFSSLFTTISDTKIVSSM
jgi:hypothetical protein